MFNLFQVNTFLMFLSLQIVWLDQLLLSRRCLFLCEWWGFLTPFYLSGPDLRTAENSLITLCTLSIKGFIMAFLWFWYFLKVIQVSRPLCIRLVHKTSITTWMTLNHLFYEMFVRYSTFDQLNDCSISRFDLRLVVDAQCTLFMVVIWLNFVLLPWIWQYLYMWDFSYRVYTFGERLIGSLYFEWCFSRFKQLFYALKSELPFSIKASK